MAILLGRDDIVHELLAQDDALLNQPVKLQSCATSSLILTTMKDTLLVVSPLVFCVVPLNALPS
jgi:hypothetical protein